MPSPATSHSLLNPAIVGRIPIGAANAKVADPIVLFGKDDWRSVVNFERPADLDMVSRDDMAPFAFADVPEEIWARLPNGGLQPGDEPMGEAARDVHEE